MEKLKSILKLSDEQIKFMTIHGLINHETINTFLLRYEYYTRLREIDLKGCENDGNELKKVIEIDLSDKYNCSRRTIRRKIKTIGHSVTTILKQYH